MSVSVRISGGLVLAASLVCLSASFAAAQDHPAGPPAPPAADQQQAWRQQREARLQQRTDRQEKRLHDLLNLRPDQDAALKTLLTALAPTGPSADGKGPGRGGRMGMGQGAGPGMGMGMGMGKGAGAGDQTLTTPQRLDKIEAAQNARIAARQAAFQRRANAIKQFYAVLSPEQQRAFDALPGLMGRNRGGGRGFGPGGFGPGRFGPGGPRGGPGPQ